MGTWLGDRALDCDVPARKEEAELERRRETPTLVREKDFVEEPENDEAL